MSDKETEPTFKVGDRAKHIDKAGYIAKARGAEGTIRKIEGPNIHWEPDDPAVTAACHTLKGGPCLSVTAQVLIFLEDPFDIDNFARYLKTDV